MLELTLLGTSRVQVDGAAVKLPTRKGLLLLCRVGLEQQVKRYELARMLWPGLGDAQARQNLRVELYRLGRTAVGVYIQVQGSGRGAEIAQVGEWSIDALDPAHDLIDAALLPDEASDQEEVGEWLEAARARRHAAVHTRLSAALCRQEAGGDLKGAALTAQAVAALNPLDETAQAQALRLLVQSGEPEQARAAYQAYAFRLRRELDTTPGPDVRRWGEALPGAAALNPAQTVQAPLIGREALWRELRTSALPTLLLGEPGVGKSRLAHDFSAQHRPRLIVRGLAEARWWPLGAVSAPLRTLWHRGRLPTLTHTDQALLSRLIPELEPDASLDSVPAVSLTGASPEQRQALFAALSRALLPGLRRGMLVLEDLHDFDDLSLEAAGYVLAELSRMPPGERPRVLLTARPPELAQHPAASALVDSLEGRGELRRLTVGRLQNTDVLVLVRILGRTEGGTRFAARLHAATAGNPLFLLETLRHLRERGDLTNDAGGRWKTRYDEHTEFYAELDLPDTVLSTVRARVRALGDGARRVLEALAVMARPAALDTLEALTGLDAWALTAAIGAASDASLVVPRAGGYALAHDLYRQGTLAGLTPERGQLLHRQAALTLSAGAAPARDVARHWLEAGQPRQAGEWLLRAAREAEAIAAHQEALAFLDEALTLQTTPEIQARAHALAFRLHLALGNTAAAQPHLNALRRLADHERDGALEREAEVLLAELNYMESEFQRVIEITDRLLDAPLPGPLAAQMHLVRGMSLIRLARFAEAELHLREVLLSGPLQRTRRSFQVHSSLAQLYFPQGRFAEADYHAAEAEAVARVLGDSQTIAQGLLIRGVAAIASSKPAEAVPLLREAQHLAQRNNLDSLADRITLNLGTALWTLKEHAEASQAFQIAASSPHLQPEIREAAIWNLGAVYQDLGDLGQALTHCEQALASAQGRGMVTAVVRRQTMIARLRLYCGHPVGSEELAALSAEVTRLNLGEIEHFVATVALRRALLCGTDTEIESHARALEAMPSPVDEQEARTLLLAEAYLHAGDPGGAGQWVSQAPHGAWRSRLNLCLLREAPVSQTPSENVATALTEARRWLASRETVALEAALLAAELARWGDAEDVQDAQRRNDALLSSLAGRTEQKSLAHLLEE